MGHRRPPTEKLGVISKAIHQCPKKSSHCFSAESGVRITSIRYILHKDLNQEPYKFCVLFLQVASLGHISLKKIM